MAKTEMPETGRHEKDFVHDMLYPFTVLGCICLVSAALLGYTHGVTEPMIRMMKEKMAQEARIAVLPGAASFTQVDCDTEALGIMGAYKEDGGAGYVLSAENKGYGGNVAATVGLNPDGMIVGIMVDASSETQGVGTKVGTAAYLDQYIGNEDPGNIDGISGATYSSTAMKADIDAIINAFREIKEAGQ